MAFTFSNGGSTTGIGAGQFDLNASAANDGDIYVVHLIVGATQTITTPTGWTAQYNAGSGQPEGGQTHGIFSRQMDGTETTVTFDWTNTDNFAVTVLRVQSDQGDGHVTLSDFTVSTTQTDNASPYTTSSITADGGFIIYGAGGEGTSSSRNFTQSHGDTEIADVSSGSGTGESAAVYRSSGTHSGSTSKTISVSPNDLFAASWWIAEVTEPTASTNAPAGTASGSVTANQPVLDIKSSSGSGSTTVTSNAPKVDIQSPSGTGSIDVTANTSDIKIDALPDSDAVSITANDPNTSVASSAESSDVIIDCNDSTPSVGARATKYLRQ